MNNRHDGWNILMINKTPHDPIPSNTIIKANVGGGWPAHNNHGGGLNQSQGLCPLVPGEVVTFGGAPDIARNGPDTPRNGDALSHGPRL